MINYLQNYPNFIFKNYSVPEHAPLQTRTKKDLRLSLRRQIGYAHIVIILAGMYSTYREWILEEMDIANQMGKPIIAIKPWGNQRIPVAVQNYSKVVVNWNTQSIVSAIRRYSWK